MPCLPNIPLHYCTVLETSTVASPPFVEFIGFTKLSLS